MPKNAVPKHEKTLVVLDSHAVLHRAYHALPNLMTKDGRPTGALYGFATMVLSIREKLKPDYIVAAFDLPGATFRHEAFKEYKGKRPKADDMLVSQLIAARELCTALGIMVYEKEGFEADDIIGTIVHTLAGDDVRIVIATGDMDTMQLVNDDKVVVYTLKQGISETVLINEPGVVEKYGFGPDRVADYKGLRGDPSDNIPGIPGIGEKIGTELIQKFGSIEDLYAILDSKGEQPFLDAGIKQRIVELLKNHKDDAEFSKVLATIRTDAPIDFTLPDCCWEDSFDKNAFIAFCRIYDFNALIKKIEGKAPEPSNRFEAAESKEAGMRLETATSKQKSKQGNLFAPAESIDPDVLHDLQVMAWLIDSEHAQPSLEDMYATYRVSTVSELQKKLHEQIVRDDLVDVYEKIERPLYPVIKTMQARGIMIDPAYFKKLGNEYEQLLAGYVKDMESQAGESFNPRSPKQLSHVLFEKLQLGTKVRAKKTSTGMRSTKEEVLEELKGTHPIIDTLMAFREIDKLFSTYVAVLPTLADDTNRVHATFLQDGAATGRFASQNPNMQNIPASDTEGKRIRQGFVATPGFSLVAFDYSQIELRIAAELSQDPHFIEAFKSNADIHSVVAMRVFGVGPDAITKDMRRKAKVINFGVLYGMGVNALAKNLGTPRAEAETFYEQYFRQFPTLKEFCGDIVAQAKKDGFTKTLFGRKRTLPALRSPLPFIRAYAERSALNAPIQGTGADIVKIALILVDELIYQEGWTDSVYPILQVHDEIVFEIKNEAVDAVVPKIKNILEHVYELSFLHYKSLAPLAVTVEVGNNWGEMKKLDF